MASAVLSRASIALTEELGRCAPTWRLDGRRCAVIVWAVVERSVYGGGVDELNAVPQNAALSFTELLCCVFGVVGCIGAVEPRSSPGSVRCHLLGGPGPTSSLQLHIYSATFSDEPPQSPQMRRHCEA